MLRAEGANLRQSMDHTTLAHPKPWAGGRWSAREFDDERWHWPKPSRNHELHILVPSKDTRIRVNHVATHLCQVSLPARSILWLDECASMVSPELLFVQMAAALSLPELVLLGHELCGTFTRLGEHPTGGQVVDHVLPATSTEDIRAYLRSLDRARGLKRARLALSYVHDLSASLPEAVLATLYGLPREEYGYGMGPLSLNRHIEVQDTRDLETCRHRLPDLLFTFAPIGINYDGEEDHLDLRGLSAVARNTERDDGEEGLEAEGRLEAKLQSVRSKVIDDIRRNREFLTRGMLILPMTKEDLYGKGNLDSFTRQLLMCAKNLFGVDVRRFEAAIDNWDLCQGRYTLLKSFLTNSGNR